MMSNRRTSSTSVSTKSQLTDPVLESFCSTHCCLKYIHSNCWLHTLLSTVLVRMSYKARLCCFVYHIGRSYINGVMTDHHCHCRWHHHHHHHNLFLLPFCSYTFPLHAGHLNNQAFASSVVTVHFHC